MWDNPNARAPSEPGRMGSHWLPSKRAARVFLGSITTISAPSSAARLRRSYISGGVEVDGSVPHTRIRSELSTSENISMCRLPIVSLGANTPEGCIAWGAYAKSIGRTEGEKDAGSKVDFRSFQFENISE